MTYTIQTEMHEFNVNSEITLHVNDVVITPDCHIFLNRQENDHVFQGIIIGQIVTCSVNDI